jgi:hypothetical protein
MADEVAKDRESVQDLHAGLPSRRAGSKRLDIHGPVIYSAALLALHVILTKS